MKPALQLRQSQQLVMTPQLQQSIKLLQLSTLEVNQEVARMLEENPLLERMEDQPTYSTSASHDAPAQSNTQDHTESESATQDDWSDEAWGTAARAAASHDDDDDLQGEQAADLPTLREHLIAHLNLTTLDLRDRQLVSVLIEALDENGYLAQPLEEIAAMLPEELGIELDDLETALSQLQYLTEPGLAARDLGECLALQIKALPADTPGRALALQITERHLALLAAHDYIKLKKALGCDDDSLRLAQALIVQLDPKPGAHYSTRSADHVIPDVLVERRNGSWQAQLNPDALPRLRVNQLYANILQQRDDKSAQQLAGQLQEARWFIKNLQQRFDTILRVAQAIVSRQQQFLNHGEVAMRPLVLREIAEQLDLHESTISRVTTQKFMRTPRGIYEFKYFFSSGLSTDSGGTCSSTAIRALIRQLVDAENGRDPLSDSRLSEILAQQGITVARRTVAKYRESMNILPVNLRKSL